jgi:hypothetical protein
MASSTNLSESQTPGTEPTSDQPAPTASPVAQAAPVAKPVTTANQAVAAQPQAVPAESEEEQYEDAAPVRSRFLLLNAVPSWLVSMVVHAVLLLMLALLTFGDDNKDIAKILTVGSEEIEQVEEFELENPMLDPVEMQELATSDPVAQIAAVDVPIEVTTISPAADLDAAAVSVEMSDFSSETAPKGDLLTEIGAFGGTGVEGRGAKARGQMIAKYGGNAGSEAAVAAALKWLAVHQLQDGGWNFDHRVSPACAGKCDHQGSLPQARNAATAMALLPFLGAGQTHKEGTYKATVAGGLAYLVRNMKPKAGGAGALDESGGSMYSHGLASITICEAYAMTHDKMLMVPAQASINYIVYAQDPIGGGWRYQPRQPGDTSVVGWQLMALKSGHMAYLNVPPNTIRGTIKFLDTVQADGGSAYGYTSPGKGSATTAIGLLCRMYLGWKHDNPALERGVKSMSASGPSKNNMYFNYYATQVMRHYEGDVWEKWNTAMRDWLVNSQSKTGHTTGSWFIADGHGEKGGRIYSTSMATMILEVYYRHMPIYAKQAATEEFPL